ncbi:MAG: sulfotransferase family protein [Opitutaceae bacterium]
MEAFRKFLLRNFFGPITLGLTFGQWLKFLKKHGRYAKLRYWPRIVFYSMTSALNSCSVLFEKVVFRRIPEDIIVPDPVFVLGHLRSGTTHLHNLLSVDANFSFSSTLEVTYPSTFLSAKVFQKKIGSFFLSRKRPMDNVELTMDTAQEDEIALATLTGMSPYLGWIFYDDYDYYFRYMTFKGCTADERAGWKAHYYRFLQKLTWCFPGRRLISKSPPHTARIRLLLEMFPQAKFIHIHRDPYEVFQSTVNLYKKTLEGWSINPIPEQDVEALVFSYYNEMYAAFNEQRDLIPPGNFHELSFEDLETDPFRALELIYENLDLGDFEKATPALQTYIESLSNYQKNDYPELDPALKERIDSSWSHHFEQFGYSK